SPCSCCSGDSTLHRERMSRSVRRVPLRALGRQRRDSRMVRRLRARPGHHVHAPCVPRAHPARGRRGAADAGRDPRGRGLRARRQPVLRHWYGRRPGAAGARRRGPPLVLRAPRLLIVLFAVPVGVLIAMVLMYGRQTRLNPNPKLWRFFLTCATYVGAVSSMFLHLLVLGVVTLVVGAAYPLARYPDALAVAAIFAVAVVWAFVASGPRARALLIAFLGVAFLCYAAVAGPRAIPFGIMRPTSLLAAYAAATRYHYLAQAALSVVVCLTLAAIGSRIR